MNEKEVINEKFKTYLKENNYDKEFEFIESIWSNNNPKSREYNFKLNLHNYRFKLKHLVCGNEFLTSKIGFLHRNDKCPFCSKTRPSYTIDLVKKKIKDITDGEYEVLSNSYISCHKKLLFLHKKCNRTFEMTFSHFLTDGSRCKRCAHDSFRIKNYNNHIKIITNNEWELDENSDKYFNESTLLLLKHTKCGKTKLITHKNLRRSLKDYGRIPCEYCIKKSGLSLGETYIRDWLDDNWKDYTRQFRINECKDKNSLPFDFAIFKKGKEKTLENLLFLIEFDGDQHVHKKFDMSEEKFNLLKKHDRMKTSFCKKNNIDLMRIPYTQIKRLKKVLEEKFNILSSSTTISNESKNENPSSEI